MNISGPTYPGIFIITDKKGRKSYKNLFLHSLISIIYFNLNILLALIQELCETIISEKKSVFLLTREWSYADKIGWNKIFLVSNNLY